MRNVELVLIACIAWTLSACGNGPEEEQAAADPQGEGNYLAFAQAGSAEQTPTILPKPCRQ